MDWLSSRLSSRLSFSPEVAERIYAAIAQIDSAKTSWRLTGKLMPETIQRLTRSVIVTSTGASNRIEGNRLSDQEVEALYGKLRIKKFKTRDEQEVAGYLEVLQLVFEEFQAIPIKESMILQIHRDMLSYSEKDGGHRGQYKFGSNRVEAKDQSGNLIGVIFEPTPPHLAQKELTELCDWYAWAIAGKFKHPLILLANFIFEYLAIHPFQDGNGRTSRLLTNLIMLQHGYRFATVVSHEKLIEENKAEYYLALNKTQATWKSMKEDMSAWHLFIFEIFRKQSAKALALLEGGDDDALLSAKQLELWRWANQLPDREFSRKTAVEALGFHPRTVEASIKRLLEMQRLERLGLGRSTRYRIR